MSGIKINLDSLKNNYNLQQKKQNEVSTISDTGNNNMSNQNGDITINKGENNTTNTTFSQNTFVSEIPKEESDKKEISDILQRINSETETIGNKVENTTNEKNKDNVNNDSPIFTKYESDFYKDKGKIEDKINKYKNEIINTPFTKEIKKETEKIIDKNIEDKELSKVYSEEINKSTLDSIEIQVTQNENIVEAVQSDNNLLVSHKNIAQKNKPNNKIKVLIPIIALIFIGTIVLGVNYFNDSTPTKIPTMTTDIDNSNNNTNTTAINDKQQSTENITNNTVSTTTNNTTISPPPLTTKSKTEKASISKLGFNIEYEKTTIDGKEVIKYNNKTYNSLSEFEKEIDKELEKLKKEKLSNFLKGDNK